VVSAGGAASADGVFGDVLALVGVAGVVGLALVLATASVGILSGFGPRTGIARGGDTIIRFIPIRTSSGHFSVVSGVLVGRICRPLLSF
jgi:hypothetical protein